MLPNSNNRKFCNCQSATSLQFHIKEQYSNTSSSILNLAYLSSKPQNLQHGSPKGRCQTNWQQQQLDSCSPCEKMSVRPSQYKKNKKQAIANPTQSQYQQCNVILPKDMMPKQAVQSEIYIVMLQIIRRLSNISHIHSLPLLPTFSL